MNVLDMHPGALHTSRLVWFLDATQSPSISTDKQKITSCMQVTVQDKGGRSHAVDKLTR